MKRVLAGAMMMAGMTMAGEASAACGDITIGFDGTGAVSTLTQGSYAWANVNHTLLGLKCTH